MTQVDCYFDYISPFSYLMHEQLHRLPEDTNVNFIPVLFAGLLKHWGNLGPVEIERKKLFTYQHTTWLAEKLNIPFRMPDVHPFLSLPYLRLTVARNNDPNLITKIYHAIWTTELNPATDQGRNQIWEEIGVENPDAMINDPQIKTKLIENTQQAVDAGVFGVPTMIADGRLFWGLDSLDMLIDYLENPSVFDAQSMRRLERI